MRHRTHDDGRELLGRCRMEDVRGEAEDRADRNGLCEGNVVERKETNGLAGEKSRVGEAEL